MTDMSNSPVRPGHLRSLEEIEDSDKYIRTRALYREALGGVDVFLRPTASGLTVLSLDADNCPSMIGVGTRGTKQHLLHTLPPDPEKVRVAAAGYAAKRASLVRPSLEENYALRLVSSALANGLKLDSGYFITQEWRLPSYGKIDVLSADPEQGCLVIIELKKSEHEARIVSGKKGGNAWDQARAYANMVHRHRHKLYPFFERLGRALAHNHSAPEEMRDLSLDFDKEPRTLVSWPGGRFSMSESST